MHLKQTHLYAIRPTTRYITHSKNRNWSKCDVHRILNCDIYRIYFLNAMYVASACGVLHCLTIWRIIARGCRCTRCVTMCICALRGGLGGTVARRVPLVGLAVGFLVAFFVFSQKGHRRAKIREHRCKQQMPLRGRARNYDDPEGGAASKHHKRQHHSHATQGDLP